MKNFDVISVIWEAFILCTVLEMLKDFRANNSFIVQLFVKFTQLLRDVERKHLKSAPYSTS